MRNFFVALDFEANHAGIAKTAGVPDVTPFPPPEEPESKLSTGALIGIVCASIAGLMFIILTIWCIFGNK